MGRSEQEGLSRMTFVVEGPEEVVRLVAANLDRLIEVVKVEYDENFDNCQEEEDSWVSSVLGTEDDAIYDVLSEIQ